MTVTHYDRVGVPITATTSEIKRAYRKQARHTHPDHGGTAAQFRLLTDAYEVLVCPDRRADYDAVLKRSVRASSAREPESPTPSRGAAPESSAQQEEPSPRQPSKASVPDLPPRTVLKEPRPPKRPPAKVRSALVCCWIAATLLVAYAVVAYMGMVDGQPSPSYESFVLVVVTPALIGLGTWRRLRASGPRRSKLGWRGVGLVVSVGLTAIFVNAVRSGDTGGLGLQAAWVFAVGTAVVPITLILAGEALRVARARVLRRLVAEHVRWSRETERRAHAETWATMQTVAQLPGHSLWWVLEVTREGQRTRVRVTDNRGVTQTRTVPGQCFSRIWIIIDERTESIVRRCSDDRRQAWVDELHPLAKV